MSQYASAESTCRADSAGDCRANGRAVAIPVNISGMQIGFSQPFWLLATLAVLPLVRRVRIAQKAPLTLVLAAIVLTALALAEPYLRVNEPITIAVDLSSSAKLAPWRDPMWVRDLARVRLAEGSLVRVVGFAANTTPLWSGRIDEPWPDNWPRTTGVDETHLDSVLSGTEPRWVISDGFAVWPQNVTGPVAATIIAPKATDFGILTAHVEANEDGKSRQARVLVSASGKGDTQVICRAGGKALWLQKVSFAQAGTRWISGPAQIGLMQIQLVGGDPWADDDAASVVTEAEGERTSVVVTPKRPLNESLAELSSVSLVVFDSVTDMNDAAADTLRRYVHDTGGGLLMLGGAQRWIDGPAELSPLTHENPKRAPLRIWFLIDSSGSMAQLDDLTMTRRDVAISAMRGAVATLRADDRVNLMLFNQAIQEYRRELKPAEQIEQLKAPTGATRPDCVLPELKKDLKRRDVVVLITDGEIPQMDVARWHTLLAGKDAKLIVVAPPQAGKVVEQLSQGHRWAQANRPAEWRMLLSQIVADATQPGDRRTDAVAWRHDGPPALTGTTRMWTESWLKPMAHLRAQADTYALAATWQYGLGKVAAISFVDVSTDSAELQKRLMDEVRAATGDRRFTMSALRGYAEWTVQIDARDDDRWMNGLLLEVGAQDGRFSARQVAPGRYEARVTQSSGNAAPVFVLMHEGRAVRRIAPAVVPLPEAPAVSARAEIPENVVRIGAAPGFRWQPAATGVVNLNALCWCAAGACLVVAMGMRAGEFRKLKI